VEVAKDRAWCCVVAVLAAALMLPPANSGWAKSAQAGKPVHALGKQKKSDSLKHGERTAGKGLHRARHDAATRCSVGAANTIRAFSGIASAYTGDRQSAKEDMTAAHCTLPFGTRVEVTNVVSGRTVVVTITDRGPFVRGRVLDLSPAAARAIGLTKGVVRIKALVM
jgi:rare lipoprotein A (peptidoglycan hydrolase)